MLHINPKSLSKLSHNIHRNSDTLRHYPGDTALTMNATAKANMSSNGDDPTGIGRWNWTRLEGRYKIFSTWILAYRPCTNKSRLSTTWSQHVRYFRDQGIVKPHPRDQFDKDLIIFIIKTLRKGDNVVPGINMNEDTRSGKLAQ